MHHSPVIFQSVPNTRRCRGDGFGLSTDFEKHSGTIAVQDGLDELPIVRRSHPDRTFASGQQVFDPLPLIVTQSEPPHRSAPHKLTAYESKKPPRRNQSPIIRRRLMAECGNRDLPAQSGWRPPAETG